MLQKKKRGRKKETQGSIYPHLLLEFTLKRSMRSASYAWRKRRAACRCGHAGHTRVVLLSIVRMQVLAAVPLLFTALHMYSPSSSGKVSGR